MWLVKRTLQIFCLFSIAFIVSVAVLKAQNKTIKTSGNKSIKTTELARVAASINQKHQSAYQEALVLAKKNKWLLRQTAPDGSVISFQGLDESGKPTYYSTQSNAVAARTTQTDLLWTGSRTGYNLSGSSDFMAGKLGIWDGGKVRNTHQELLGKVTQEDNSPELDNHATHVAGTMVGAGINLAAKGMSFGATLKAWDFESDTPEMVAEASHLLVSNHSYGSLCGWRSAGRGWEWWGDPEVNATFDWKFGYYNTTARDWDIIAYYAPYYLPVKAAGNNRHTNGPASGATYFLANTNITSTVDRSRNDGYDIVTTNGTAKNILTVGAVNPILNGYFQPSDVQISAFSSWGPTDDGRIKPDIVGDGVNVLSAGSGSDNAYYLNSGTSMASPNIAGSLFLLQELHAQRHEGRFMRSATLKGVVLHTTQEAGAYPGPDYIHGWGLLNAKKAADVIANADQQHLVNERELLPNQTYSFQVVASGQGPLVATICWTDPEASVTLLSPSAVNNRTPKLVNDLDIRITQGNVTYLPWTLDPDKPANPAVPGDNIRDNVEKIEITDPVPGKTYLISIFHKGTLTRGSQAYSIVLSGIGGAYYCNSAPEANHDSKISRVVFGAIDNTTESCTATYSDFTHLTTNLLTGQSIPLSITLGTCGANSPKIAKAFIDWNGNGNFDDANELVATSAIITGTQTYATQVTVPSGVKPGHSARMRIICVETNTPNDIQPCGNYQKGETHDYRVAFLQPAKDVGITALLSPNSALCAGSQLGGVTLAIRNYGTTVQTNIPVTCVVANGTATVATLKTIFRGQLYPNAEASVILSGAFEVEADKEYTFTSSTALPDDIEPGNNTYKLTRTATTPSIPTASATICGSSSTLLKGQGNGLFSWYDAPVDGNRLATGNLVRTDYRPANRTYYASVNTYGSSVGPLSKSEFNTGSYNQFDNSVYFTTYAPVVLQSARLYIGNAGRITITVFDSRGLVAASTTLDVTNTRNPATSGYASDDANDTGQVYFLNLELPKPDTYQIALSYENGATIFRNNANAYGYPFTIPGVLAITGNSAGSNTYAYFYDLRVQAIDCPSPRIAVLADIAPDATASITVEGSTTFCEKDSVLLKADQGSGFTYQWQKEEADIPGATDATFMVKQAGFYTVIVTNSQGCAHVSDQVEIKVTPVSPISVAIVPASSPVACTGETMQVRLTAITSYRASLLSYQWMKEGIAISQATDSIYVATEPGIYTVTVKVLPCGTATSEPFTLSKETPQLTAEGKTICGLSGTVRLTAQSSSGSMYWYDAPTDGNLLATGPAFTTPILTTSRQYYVSVNDFQGVVKTPDPEDVGMFTSVNGRMYFDAEVPFMLEKATLRILGGASPLAVTVALTDRNGSNTIIATSRINVTVGTNEYALNLYIPAAGKQYSIQILTFEGGATAYQRTNASYPYTLPGIVSITGTNQSNLADRFYYLYNWKVKAVGCQLAERLEVPVTVTRITAPSANMSGNADICLGESATLRVDLQGTAPWSITYTNGQTPVTIDDIQQSPYQFKVSKEASYTLLSVYDSRGCSNGSVAGSAKVQVIARSLEQPAVFANGSTSFCLGKSVSLSAPKGFTYYKWSNGETSRTIIVQQSGTFSVAVGQTTCLSPPSDEVVVNVYPETDQPIISIQGRTDFCLGDSVILTAPEGFNVYQWSNGETSRQITVKQNGEYTVIVGNPGCLSPVSGAVNVTVSTTIPPTPTITLTGARLSSNSKVNNQWLYEGSPIAGATQQTYNITKGGSYSVKVTQGLCESISREINFVITGLEEKVLANELIRLYPNPASENFRLVYRTASQTVTAMLYNAQGILLGTTFLHRTEADMRADFSIGHLPKGVYFVRIKDGDTRYVKAFVKE